MAFYQVHQLWRYPVKSMGGERLASATVDGRGISGDRAFALLDTSRNEVATAKNTRRFADLLLWSARFQPDGSAHIYSPDDSLQSVEQLCAAFGPDAAFVSSAPSALQFQTASGTLFDYAAIHIINAATLRALGSACPEATFAIERFRPNIVVDAENAIAFAENNWAGRVIAIGPEVRVRVTIACPRCVMTTLPSRTLPLEPKILTTAAARNTLHIEGLGDQPCVGVYAEVERGGQIRLGHSMHVL